MSCLWCLISWAKYVKGDEDEVEKIIKKVERKEELKRKHLKKDKYQVINGELFEDITI